MPRIMQPMYSLACLDAIPAWRTCEVVNIIADVNGIVSTMAPKPKSSPKPKSMPKASKPSSSGSVPAPKKSENKTGPWDDIGRGVKKFNDAMRVVNKVTYEVSGAGDVERFVKKPTAKNAAMLGVTIAAYAGGPAFKAGAAAKAGKAAIAAEKAVLATQKASLARPIAEKSMTFATKLAKTGEKIPTGKLITKAEKSLPVSGFVKATTAKNVKRVTAGRIAAVNAKADRVGKAVVKEAMTKAAPRIAANTTAGKLLAGSKAGTTYVAAQKKNNKKK